MLATGTKNNSYYRAKLTNITGTVTVGCKLSYGAMYTMLLIAEWFIKIQTNIFAL